MDGEEDQPPMDESGIPADGGEEMEGQEENGYGDEGAMEGGEEQQQEEYEAQQEL